MLVRSSLPAPGTSFQGPSAFCGSWGLRVAHQTLTQAACPPLGTPRQGHHQQDGSGDRGRAPSSLPAEMMLSPSPGVLSTPLPTCATPVSSVTHPCARCQTHAMQGQQRGGSGGGRRALPCVGVPAAPQ